MFIWRVMPNSQPTWIWNAHRKTGASIDPAGIQENIVEELAGELITSGVLDEPLPPPAEPAKLFLHMDAMFEELPTDGELEVQGFVRDHSRETHYGA